MGVLVPALPSAYMEGQKQNRQDRAGISYNRMTSAVFPSSCLMLISDFHMKNSLTNTLIFF